MGDVLIGEITKIRIGQETPSWTKVCDGVSLSYGF